MRESWIQKIKTSLLGALFIKRHRHSGGLISFGQGVILIAALIVLFLINTCSPDEVKNTTVSRPNAMPSSNSVDIEDHIVNSYARLAAKRSDVCPKLLQQDVDSPSIRRRDEVMIDDHCDYFLYPHAGEQITVVVADPKIEALLIVPTMHNFANGEYQVDSYDKHVIRLSYNGAYYKPKRLKYDVTIKINDQSEEFR